MTELGPAQPQLVFIFYSSYVARYWWHTETGQLYSYQKKSLFIAKLSPSNTTVSVDQKAFTLWADSLATPPSFLFICRFNQQGSSLLILFCNLLSEKKHVRATLSKRGFSFYCFVLMVPPWFLLWVHIQLFYSIHKHFFLDFSSFELTFFY